MITDVSDITSFKWATVTANAPLAIRLDGDTVSLALIPDSLVDPLSLFVGERVRVELSLRKVVVHGVANGGAEAGIVQMTAANNPPAGWLRCDGGNYFRSSYPRLFAAIGTIYGAVNAESFNVPDLRGRVPVGGDGYQAEFNVLGRVGGEKYHTLTVAEMPSHAHGYRWGQSGASPGTGNMYAAGWDQGRATDVNGGDGAHNNLQPYIALNFIIKI